MDRKREILDAFQCQGSGNCCRVEGYVRINQDNLEQMAAIKGMSPLEFKSKYVVMDRGWMTIASPRHRPLCFLNEANKCEVYDGRPKACRRYPDWPEIWQDEDSLMLELAVCPGLREAYHKIVG